MNNYESSSRPLDFTFKIYEGYPNNTIDFEAYFCEGNAYRSGEIEDVVLDCWDDDEIQLPVESKSNITYEVSINISKIKKFHEYGLKIRYTILDYVEKEGDYHLILLRTAYDGRDSNKINISKWVVLPKVTSMLDKFPLESEVRKFGNRWLIKIDSPYAKFIRFMDSKELQDKDIKNIALGAVLGALFGALFSQIIKWPSEREEDKQITQVGHKVDELKAMLLTQDKKLGHLSWKVGVKQRTKKGRKQERKNKSFK